MTGASDKGRARRLIAGVGAVRLLGVLVVASVVLPALLFAGFSYLSYRTHLSQEESRLRQTLDVVHEHVRKVFETHELAALHIRDLMHGRTDDAIKRSESDLHDRLAALKATMPQVRDLRVLDATGKPLVSASIYPFGTNPGVAEDDFFKMHRDGLGGSYISDLITSRQRTGTFFLESRRWQDDSQRFRGIIIISVDPEYFHTFFRGFPKGHVFSVVKANGAVLARYPNSIDPINARLPVGSGLLSEIAKAPQEGMYIATSGLDGVQRIASYRKLPDRPLYLTANYGMPQVIKAWRDDIISHATLAGPATFGLFLITLLAFGQARRERQALERLRDEIELRQRTEAQLVQAQKMEAVGRLTGGIAHDFNNLLTVIMGNLETAVRQLPKANDRVKRALANAQLAAERAAALTHRLLAFSRRQPLEAKPVELNALVSSMADLMRRTIGETISIDSKLSAGLWTALADPNQTENALLNLVINARDAMPEGGRLTIETTNAVVGEMDEMVRKQDATPGQYAVLSVADSGTGMTPEILNMVFEPFFTTKPAGHGTGLGLSMVYGFMQQTRGHVRIESEVGRGTTVRLYFPRADLNTEPPALAARPEIPVEASGNGETILVCEDDSGVRNFSAQTLRDLGYRVVEAGDMREALAVLAAHPEIAALFTDVVLPGDGNGRILADEARRRRPNLKVLFTTGYTRDAIVHDGRLDEGVELLNKPFSSAELARRIRALFDS